MDVGGFRVGGLAHGLDPYLAAGPYGEGWYRSLRVGPAVSTSRVFVSRSYVQAVLGETADVPPPARREDRRGRSLVSDTQRGRSEAQPQTIADGYRSTMGVLKQDEHS
jgi:hypothetical protein